MCNRPKCACCERRYDLVSRDERWICKTTEESFIIRNYSCNHRFIVYVIFCDNCGKHYVGSTYTTFSTRIGDHRRQTIKCPHCTHVSPSQPQPQSQPHPSNHNSSQHNNDSNNNNNSKKITKLDTGTISIKRTKTTIRKMTGPNQQPMYTSIFNTNAMDHKTQLLNINLNPINQLQKQLNQLA